eukprot:TRINITY_DN5572_c0_g1_i10.p2 TRINITY_DN5572_c0_g1~~TRINITY_DN5572_c0_g1_i10.p2  ORF type:complete len:137 (-),score=20.18 TRINITY_DN5572_c0_g1_i10:80-490(-)
MCIRDSSNAVRLIQKEPPLLDRVPFPELFEEQQEIYTTLYAENQLSLKSAYQDYTAKSTKLEQPNEKIDRHPPYTNYTPNFKGTIDFIFYADQRFSPIDLKQIPDEKTLTGIQGCPSHLYPSDHFPLMVTFGMHET